MLVAMKLEAEESINERRQIFEATREELKVNNIRLSYACIIIEKYLFLVIIRTNNDIALTCCDSEQKH